MISRICIVGGKGLLGRSIAPILSASADLTILDIDDWDIADPGQGEKVLDRLKPEVLINLAAFTNVDACEDHEEEARKVNGDAPGVLAGLSHVRGVRFVHISTDYVFDGFKTAPYKETDEPNPLSAYGRTKLAGERRVAEECPSAIIIRTQWLYGRNGVSFIDKVTAIAAEKGVVGVVNDQRGAPTYARDLAEPILVLLAKGRSGIYHVANSGSCTWFDLACEVFRLKGMAVEVRPITSAQLDRKAPRPFYSVFDCTKLAIDAGITLRPWQAALREYLTGAQ